VLLICWTGATAQEVVVDDSVQFKADSTVFRTLGDDVTTIDIAMEAPEHSPTRALLLSATIPGLGQFYNKKYWKVPIVWAGLGTFAYFIRFNDEQYQFYRRNLIYEVEQDPEFLNETNLDQTSLKSARDQYRRARDQLALYGILFYVVQIIDAHVDAHLIEFDVNQDLSVRFEPTFTTPINGRPSFGMALKFKF